MRPDFAQPEEVVPIPFPLGKIKLPKMRKIALWFQAALVNPTKICG